MHYWSHLISMDPKEVFVCIHISLILGVYSRVFGEFSFFLWRNKMSNLVNSVATVMECRVKWKDSELYLKPKIRKINDYKSIWAGPVSPELGCYSDRQKRNFLFLCCCWNVFTTNQTCEILLWFHYLFLSRRCFGLIFKIICDSRSQTNERKNNHKNFNYVWINYYEHFSRVWLLAKTKVMIFGKEIYWAKLESLKNMHFLR